MSIKMPVAIYRIPLFILVSLIMINSNAQKANAPIPMYAEPYYSSQPLKITIGKYKKALLTTDSAELLRLADTIQADLNNTDIESIYFLSIRLYDLGRKDEAFYWFHMAKSRSFVLTNMIDLNEIGGIGSPAFELYQLVGAINGLAGQYINGYGFGDLNKALAVFEKLRSAVKDIQSFKLLYPSIHFIDDDNLEKIKSAYENELGNMISYIQSHREEIQLQRKQNGIDNKY